MGRSSVNGHYELLRFCNKLNSNVFENKSYDYIYNFLVTLIKCHKLNFLETYVLLIFENQEIINILSTEFDKQWTLITSKKIADLKNICKIKKYFYKKNVSRLDKISQDYYGSPYFGWLIMLANPEYGGLEWNIPNGALLAIPFPLTASIQDYEANLKKYFFYYGR